MKFTPRMRINHLGPIEQVDILLNRMMVFNGPQAAGKSTIAKALFFFRTVKDELLRLFFVSAVDPVPALNAQFFLRKKFLQIFGRGISWNDDMFLSYEYAPGVKIELGLSLEKSISIKFSPKLIEWMEEKRYLKVDYTRKGILQEELEDLFQDNCEIVYIPAGRSMLSILSDQFDYIMASLDDNQKSMIDYCVRNYIERVMRIRPSFSLRAEELFSLKDYNDLFFLHYVSESMGHILKGQYRYIDGTEQLVLFHPNRKIHIPIAFASSGQQEVLWILNFIYYYIAENKPTLFIIEEPEAHLFPDTQKQIAEYISLLLAKNNECLITTHSPYILGALNNLLDLWRIKAKGISVSSILEANNLIGPQLLCGKDFSAYFIQKGTMMDAMDNETGMIRNELIDGASDDINSLADKLLDLEWRSEE